MDFCTNGAYSVGIIVIMTCVQIRTYPNYKHRLRTEQSGFLYGDALMAVTLVLLILPIILYVLSSTLSIVKTTYTHDYILQDSLSYIEAGKAVYDSGGIPTTGTISSSNGHKSNGHNLSNITFKQSVTEEVVNGVSILRFIVQAVDNGVTVYEISTFLGSSHH